MKLIGIKVLALVMLVGLITLFNKANEEVEREEALNKRLSNCLKQTEYTDTECDSCYAITYINNQ